MKRSWRSVVDIAFATTGLTYIASMDGETDRRRTNYDPPRSLARVPSRSAPVSSGHRLGPAPFWAPVPFGRFPRQTMPSVGHPVFTHFYVTQYGRKEETYRVSARWRDVVGVLALQLLSHRVVEGQNTNLHVLQRGAVDERPGQVVTSRDRQLGERTAGLACLVWNSHCPSDVHCNGTPWCAPVNGEWRA